MANVMGEIPQELVDLLGQSALASLDVPERVRVALAIHLFTSEQVSLGRAAELAGYALVDFQDVLRSLGIPVVIYDREEYDRDQKGEEFLRERLGLTGRDDRDPEDPASSIRSHTGDGGADATFAGLAANAALHSREAEPTEDQVIESVRRLRGELYDERYGGA